MHTQKAKTLENVQQLKILPLNLLIIYAIISIAIIQKTEVDRAMAELVFYWKLINVVSPREWNSVQNKHVYSIRFKHDSVFLNKKCHFVHIKNFVKRGRAPLFDQSRFIQMRNTLTKHLKILTTKSISAAKVISYHLYDFFILLLCCRPICHYTLFWSDNCYFTTHSEVSKICTCIKHAQGIWACNC